MEISCRPFGFGINERSELKANIWIYFIEVVIAADVYEINQSKRVWKEKGSSSF